MHVPKSLPATETDESHRDSKVTNDRSIVYVYIYIEPYAIQYKNGRWSFNLQPSLFCDNMFLEPINLAWKTGTRYTSEQRHYLDLMHNHWLLTLWTIKNYMDTNLLMPMGHICQTDIFLSVQELHVRHISLAYMYVIKIRTIKCKSSTCSWM